jgi:spermidine synthase
MSPDSHGPGEVGRAGGALPPLLRAGVYAAFFASGGTALIFEVVWSRQFVTVFGNSSYAISVVLCAFMAGLGIGGLLGGRLADRLGGGSRGHLLAYGAIQLLVAGCAVAISPVLVGLRKLVPAISLLSPGSLLLSSTGRFAISFGVLLIPCLLMGATLPLLVRFCTESDRMVGRRVGMLYGLNTLGAALGCYAAAHWLIDGWGLAATNRLAVGLSALVGLAMLAAAAACHGSSVLQAAPAADSGPATGQPAGSVRRGFVLALAFVSGLAALSCEVLWVRFLAFLSNVAYAFPLILTIYLLGVALGSLIYRAFLSRSGRPAARLAVVVMLLAVAVPACFTIAALAYAASEPGALTLRTTALLTMLVPTVLMGIAFPLICAAYTPGAASAGRSVGMVYAANTAGTIAGALLPVFVLVPTVGIQGGLLLMAWLYWVAGAVLFSMSSERRGRGRLIAGAVGLGVLVVVFVGLVPGDLCKRVFLATSYDLGRHNDVGFYREGRTGTAVVARDRITGLDWVYINGTDEVPTTYSAMSCFKFMGGLGPLLHPNPDRMLMICFGGGVAAGATVQYPQVKSLEIVDLENSVVEAARLLDEQNNGLLDSPKVKVHIDDGRNFILTSPRRWPVIVCDSTHPKSSDSWVLYTQEFYRTVRDHLTADGVVVQWVPVHGMSVAEYKIIVRTFMSILRNATLWVSHGVDETGRYTSYSLLTSTPEPLAIDVAELRRRIAAPDVAADLAPLGLDSPVALLEHFVRTGPTLAEWVGEGPVNTDDLPYTQYATQYSGGPSCSTATFAEPMESIWPYLRNAAEEAPGLEAELRLHLAANQAMLRTRSEDSFALLRDDVKSRLCLANIARGRRYLQKVADLYRDRPAALIWFAKQYLSQPGGFRASLDLYRLALAADPGNAVAHTSLGIALAQTGATQEALQHLRAAVAADPGYALAHYNLAAILSGQGEGAEAAAHFRLAVAADPGFAEARTSLGAILLQQGRLAEAEQQFARAMRLKPEYATAHCRMGELRLAQGNPSAAAVHFRDALRLRPGYEAARRGLAQSEAAGGAQRSGAGG